MVNDTEYEGMRIAEEVGSKLAELSMMIEAIHYDPEGITKNDIFELEMVSNRLDHCLRKAKEIQENQKEAQAAK